MKTFRTFAAAAVAIGLAMSLSAIGAFAAAGPLVVTKSANTASVLPGGNVTYTISVRNSGDTAADNVAVTDTLNNNLTFMSGSPTPIIGAGSGGTTDLTFNLGSIAPGATSTATVTANVSSGITTNATVTNTATATSSNAGTASSNAVSISVGPVAPSIIISKVPTASTVTAGGTLMYAVTVRNIGGSSATGVTVTDMLDPATTLISSTPAADSTAGNTMTFNVGTLASNTSFTFTTNVRVNAGTTVGAVINNSVRTTGSNFDPVSATSAVTVVSGSPTPTPSTSITPTPSRTPTPSSTALRVVTPTNLPTTGLGTALIWIIIGLAVLSLWPLLRSRRARLGNKL